jgi:hypothetical protein
MFETTNQEWLIIIVPIHLPFWVYRIHREKLHFRTNSKAPPQNVPVLGGYTTQQYSNGEMSQYEITTGGSYW